MPRWSKYCIDPTAGFTLQEDGSMKPNKIGYWVKTIEELDEIIKNKESK
jgi:hypothetical protein